MTCLNRRKSPHLEIRAVLTFERSGEVGPDSGFRARWKEGRDSQPTSQRAGLR